MVTVTVNFIF